jgi:pimeloyl-ACP methyl ester carboxylesterase
MIIDRRIGRNFTRLHIDNCLLICHGLPYEPGSVIEKGYSVLAKFFSSKKFTTVVFDFTGTGLSEGDFRLSYWVEDLKNLTSYFEKVSILGYSMGGAVAIRASAELENVEKLAIVASPCCMDMFSAASLEMIYENAKLKGILRGLKDFESFKDEFLRDFEDIEPINWIEKIRCPKLIVHGDKDDIVPFKHGEMLYRMARKPKTFLRVKNGDHFLRQEEVVSKYIADWFTGKIGEKELEIRI